VAESLWPSDITSVSFRTPVATLKEQAAALGTATREIVTAEVIRIAQEETFLHKFVIVSPSLGAYRYELFSVWHSAIVYPLNLRWKNTVFSIGTNRNSWTNCDKFSMISPQRMSILAHLRS